MSIDLIEQRDYQIDASNELREKYDSGTNRLLGRMFTGGGKTTGIAAFIPKYFEDIIDVGTGGLLFLSHRREILYHAYKKFDALYPNKWIGLEMGEHHATGAEDFIFASVHSIGRLMSDRIYNYKRRKFPIIIADEGHNISPEGVWDNVLTYFGVGSDPDTHYTLKGGVKPLLLMLTATPCEEVVEENCILKYGFDRFVDDIGFNYGIEYGIRNGWLVDIKSYFAHPKNPDRVNGTDLLIKVYKDYALGDKTLVFASSVDESSEFAHSLSTSGLAKAAHIDADTPKRERDVIVPDFGSDAKGAISVLSNRFVFKEGYDNQYIQTIIDNAPTENIGVFLQKLGRGLRPHPTAKVDTLNNPTERKNAIAQSKKPYLKYISTFDPTGHKLTLPKTLFGVDTDIKANGHLLVEEVIDKIRLVEKEQPERPIRSIKDVDEIELTLHKADLWNQTVYNEELQSRTQLRWILKGENAGLYLPENPLARTEYEKTPTILYWKYTSNGYQLYLITEGGWVEDLGHPVKATVRKLGTDSSLSEGISNIDSWLSKSHPSIYSEVIRDGLGKADKWQRQYMARVGILFASDVSQEIARLLIDDYKITKKIEDVGL